MRKILLTHLCLALAAMPAYAQGNLGTSAQAPGTDMSRSADTTSPGTTDPARSGGQVTDGRSSGATSGPTGATSSGPNIGAPMGVNPGGGTGAGVTGAQTAPATGGTSNTAQGHGTAAPAGSGVTNAPVGAAMDGSRGGQAAATHDSDRRGRDGRVNVVPAGTAGVGDQPGANSFTEGQARARIEEAGFSQVGELTRDGNGVWRGQAMREGRQVQVGLDFQGTVTFR